MTNDDETDIIWCQTRHLSERIQGFSWYLSQFFQLLCLARIVNVFPSSLRRLEDDRLCQLSRRSSEHFVAMMIWYFFWQASLNSRLIPLSLQTLCMSKPFLSQWWGWEAWLECCKAWIVQPVCVLERPAEAWVLLSLRGSGVLHLNSFIWNLSWSRFNPWYCVLSRYWCLDSKMEVSNW